MHTIIKKERVEDGRPGATERHGRFRPGVMAAKVLRNEPWYPGFFGFKTTSLRNLFCSFCSLFFYSPSISEPRLFFSFHSPLRVPRGMLRLI